MLRSKRATFTAPFQLYAAHTVRHRTRRREPSTHLHRTTITSTIRHQSINRSDGAFATVLSVAEILGVF